MAEQIDFKTLFKFWEDTSDDVGRIPNGPSFSAGLLGARKIAREDL